MELIKMIAKDLCGSGALSFFELAAKKIKFQRAYNDNNLSALRGMLNGADGLSMSSFFFPWEGRFEETVDFKKQQFKEVMSFFGVTQKEISVLLEGNPRNK